MRVKMKNRSYRHDIDRTMLRHRYEYPECKMHLSRFMVMWNKQHLSKVWRWLYEKVKQHWGWVEGNALLIEKCIVLHLNKIK